jgi:hypothetical protein
MSQINYDIKHLAFKYFTDRPDKYAVDNVPIGVYFGYPWLGKNIALYILSAVSNASQVKSQINILG